MRFCWWAARRARRWFPACSSKRPVWSRGRTCIRILRVALGAGVMASRLAGRAVERVLVDVSPYSFGVSYLGERGGYRVSALLQADHPAQYAAAFDAHRAVPDQPPLSNRGGRAGVSGRRRGRAEEHPGGRFSHRRPDPDGGAPTRFCAACASIWTAFWRLRRWRS